LNYPGPNIRRYILLSLLSCTCAFLIHPRANGQQAIGPEAAILVAHGVTPPLRLMRPILNNSQTGEEGAAENLEVESEGRHPHANDATRNGSPFDTALQANALKTLAVTMGLNFDGVSSVNFSTSDANGAAGATQFVQYVNWSFSVYNKSTGNKVLGPVSEFTLWKSLGGGCANSIDGDIIVLYDKAAGRWIFTHHAIPSGGPFLQCFAISKTSDATGAYFLYAYQLTSQFPDYPKLGTWSDGYYLSTNLENPSTFQFVASQVCAFQRAKMLIGASAQVVCFQTPAFDSLLPADIDGTTPPATGSPEIFLSLGSTNLNLFKFKVNWTTPSNSTFAGPVKIPVAAYSEACAGLQCVPQLDTSQVLDSLGDRLMYRLAYRHFSTFESLVVTHSVVAGTSTGLRWYEIRGPHSTTPSLHQQGTYAPDSKYRWMGSIAQDKLGNMALGYSLSSATQHPAIAFTGRVATDPVGTMESEINVITGAGSEQSPNFRWGDYSSMSVDPVDDCTFWYTNQYYPADSSSSWNTRVVSFKFPSCH
jgi:hypothetical protein